MKYYAVTEDPNELLHYGVKGMKWGKHLFGDDLRPKSHAYKNALGKLRGFAKKASKSVKKSVQQMSMDRQKKQQEKYNQAVAKAQNRINTIENLRNVDTITNYEKQLNRDYSRSKKQAAITSKYENNNAKVNARLARRYAKNEGKMDKFMQQAREGTLKYGQLSEDQVRRVTDRLALERSARSLGNTEKPKFRSRLKDAIQEGVLQGVVQGTAAGMKEVAVAKVQNRLSNKRALDKENRLDAQRQREANRIRNKKTRKDIRDEVKQEAYEADIRNGTSVWDRGSWYTTSGAAKRLNALNEQNSERQFRLEQERKNIDAKRQDQLNAERAEEQLRERAKLAYDYGFLESDNNKGKKGNKGNKDNKDNNDTDELKRLANYYKQRYIEGETNDQRADRIRREQEKEQARLEKEQKRKAAEDKRRAKREARAQKMAEESHQRFKAMVAAGAADQLRREIKKYDQVNTGQSKENPIDEYMKKHHSSSSPKRERMAEGVYSLNDIGINGPVEVPRKKRRGKASFSY